MIVKHFWLLQLDICFNILLWKYGKKMLPAIEELSIHIPEYKSYISDMNNYYIRRKQICTKKEQIEKLREKYAKTGNVLFIRLEKYILHQKADISYDEIEYEYIEYIKHKFKYFKIAKLL